MSYESFEEEFPSIETKPWRDEDMTDWMLLKADEVIKHCLDKQRVKEIIDKLFPHKDTIVFEYGINPKERIYKELGLE